MSDLYYLWQLHGESLIWFLLEGAQIVAIAILLYREWLRWLEKKEKLVIWERVEKTLKCVSYGEKGQRNLYCYNCSYDNNCPYDREKGK